MRRAILLSHKIQTWRNTIVLVGNAEHYEAKKDYFPASLQPIIFCRQNYPVRVDGQSLDDISASYAGGRQLALPELFACDQLTISLRQRTVLGDAVCGIAAAFVGNTRSASGSCSLPAAKADNRLAAQRSFC